MFIRYLSSAAIGAAATSIILWCMQALIDLGETVIVDPRSDPPMFVGRTVIEDPPKPYEPPRPPRPDVEIPLEMKPPVDPGGDGPTRITPVRSTLTPPNIGKRTTLSQPDSGLISIIYVQPEYPVSLITRGIEGHVTVSFDVTAMGTVENVVVVESSHRGFNNAAIKAAYRARFKARTVDGVPQPTFNVRKRYRFEIDR